MSDTVVKVFFAAQKLMEAHPAFRDGDPVVSYMDRLHNLLQLVSELADEEDMEMPIRPGLTLEDYTADLLLGNSMPPEEALNKWFADTNGRPPFNAELRVIK